MSEGSCSSDNVATRDHPQTPGATPWPVPAELDGNSLAFIRVLEAHTRTACFWEVGIDRPRWLGSRQIPPSALPGCPGPTSASLAPFATFPNSSTVLARVDRPTQGLRTVDSLAYPPSLGIAHTSWRFAVTPPDRTRALLLEGTPPAPRFPPGPLMVHSSPFTALSPISREGARSFLNTPFVVSTVYAAITVTPIQLNQRSSDPHFSPDRTREPESNAAGGHLPLHDFTDPFTLFRGFALDSFRPSNLTEALLQSVLNLAGVNPLPSPDSHLEKALHSRKGTTTGPTSPLLRTRGH